MPTIYYIPGRGGRLDQGLGLELSARGFDLIGREISRRGSADPNNAFGALPFEQQLEVVQHDLKTHASHPDALVIGHSFGAYLIAHAILQLGSCPGKCLFVSPVLGASQTHGLYFKPPKAGALKQAITNGSHPQIILDVLVGSRDEQSSIQLCQKLTEVCQGSLHIAEGQGHRLEPDTVKAFLDGWLAPHKTE